MISWPGFHGCIKSLILPNMSTSGSTNGSVFIRGVVPSMTWNVAEAVGMQRLMASVVPMVNNPAMVGSSSPSLPDTSPRALSKSVSSKVSSELFVLVSRMCWRNWIPGFGVQICELAAWGWHVAVICNCVVVRDG